MICPGCGEKIDLPDVWANPRKYFTYANNYGEIWHSICVSKVLKGWKEGNQWIEEMRRMVRRNERGRQG